MEITEAIIAGIGADDNALGQMMAILANLSAAGYVIVPKRPTAAMLDRAKPYMDSYSSNLAWWDAMLTDQ